MKKRNLIEALSTLEDDTEILIVDGVPCRQFEYIDDRFADRLIRKNQVRLCGHRELKPWDLKPIIHPKILGVDPLRPSAE